MPYGLLSTGFLPKPLTVIRADLEAAYKAVYGVSIGSEPDGSIPANTAIGQHIGIHSERLAELWEVSEAVYSAMDPDSAEDAALDLLCQITGTTRSPATRSIVVASLTGVPASAIPLGTKLAVLGTAVIFQTVAASAIGAAHTAWAATTAYALGARVTSAGGVYHCIGAGTSGAVAPTATTDSPIVDGTVSWAYLGPGTASVDTLCEAVDTGAFACLARQLRTIQTPTVGLLGVNNLVAGTVGADKETNAALRLRRAIELRGRGNATVDAIRRSVLKVNAGTANAVTSCLVFENTSLLTSPDGIPGKAFETVVLGGLDQALRDAILASKPAGIEAHGSTSGGATDSMGITHIIKFTRPVEALIWINLDLLIDDALWPLDGPDLVRAAIVADSPYYVLGMDARPWRIGAVLDSVPGLLAVSQVRLGLAPFPAGTVTIPIGLREIARFDASRIVTINVIPVTP